MNSMRHVRAASLPPDDPLRANIEAIVRGDHGDPFAVLGPHPTAPRGQLSLRVFAPEADEVDAISTEEEMSSRASRVCTPVASSSDLSPRRNGPCTGCASGAASTCGKQAILIDFRLIWAKLTSISWRKAAIVAFTTSSARIP